MSELEKTTVRTSNTCLNTFRCCHVATVAATWSVLGKPPQYKRAATNYETFETSVGACDRLCRVHADAVGETVGVSELWGSNSGLAHTFGLIRKIPILSPEEPKPHKMMRATIQPRLNLKTSTGRGLGLCSFASTV